MGSDFLLGSSSRALFDFGIAEGRDGGIEKPVAVAPVVSAPVVNTPANAITVSDREYDENDNLIRQTYTNSNGSVQENIENTVDGYPISSVRYYSNGNVEVNQRYDSATSYIISETRYYEDGSLQLFYENYPGTGVNKVQIQYWEGGILLMMNPVMN